MTDLFPFRINDSGMGPAIKPPATFTINDSGMGPAIKPGISAGPMQPRPGLLKGQMVDETTLRQQHADRMSELMQQRNQMFEQRRQATMQALGNAGLPPRGLLGPY